MDADRAEKVKELKNEFPDYQFLVLPADDIRTKKARTETPEVKGLLDEDKKVRPEYEADTRKLFETLNGYMDGP